MIFLSCPTSLCVAANLFKLVFRPNFCITLMAPVIQFATSARVAPPAQSSASKVVLLSPNEERRYSCADLRPALATGSISALSVFLAHKKQVNSSKPGRIRFPYPIRNTLSPIINSIIKMKLSYLLFASLATTAVASPQRLRSLQIDALAKADKGDGSMSMSEDAAAVEEEAEPIEADMSAASKAEKEPAAEDTDMSVASKATKLFKPSPSKSGKASMPEVEEISMAKSAKAISME